MTKLGKEYKRHLRPNQPGTMASTEMICTMQRPADLEAIRLIEKRKKPFKGYFTYTSIESTASTARGEFYTAEPGSFEKDFYPSTVRRVFIVFVLGFLLFSAFGLLLPGSSVAPVKLITVPIIVAGGFLFYDAFINPRKNYQIHLDFESIMLAEEIFLWRDIEETAILQMGSGRNQVDFLVLVFKDGSYRKFNLQAFAALWGFDSAIAAYVEYFKKPSQEEKQKAGSYAVL